MSAIDLWHATPEDLMSLIDGTEDLMAVSLLIDAHQALLAKEPDEYFRAVGALSDYVVYGPGALR